ncbi:hypothetical protein SAMN05216333_14317 [Nitrosomonas oligotropha]|uniref:Uncharacterized protein n=1 Tax=Nitrosomonas oligotropha TaxID=42354 RepID=A0A1H8V0D3_9PROT|nr:hypothetical protein SAMN05216300_12518 [Nitrosomonas oligotropha]SEP08960.1 hypothetical protein SAMN05216333_14317 [Nitrosomonas oligotropha]
MVQMMKQIQRDLQPIQPSHLPRQSIRLKFLRSATLQCLVHDHKSKLQGTKMGRYNIAPPLRIVLPVDRGLFLIQ